MGYAIQKNEKLFDKVNIKFFVVMTFLYVALGVLSILVYPGTNLDTHQGIYCNVLISFTMIFIGCSLLFAICKQFNYDNKVLVFIGQNTLVYYIWANYPITLYNIIMSRLGYLFNNVFFSALVKTLFVCCICALFSMIINLVAPEIVGKKRRKVGDNK
jgi:hypothetical protein